MKQGSIAGKVTHDSVAVPDGLLVSVQFDGGPLQNTQTRDGHYSLPLLARICSSGIRYVGFRVSAVRNARNVLPQTDQVKEDLELTEVFVDPGARAPCELVVGSLTGTVTDNGSPAPDGVIVTIEAGVGLDPAVGMDSLRQSVETRGGRFEAATIGTRCRDDLRMLRMSVKIGSVVLPVALQSEDATIDIEY